MERAAHRMTGLAIAAALLYGDDLGNERMTRERCLRETQFLMDVVKAATELALMEAGAEPIVAEAAEAIQSAYQGKGGNEHVESAARIARVCRETTWRIVRKFEQQQ